jgi:hypothetical protein
MSRTAFNHNERFPIRERDALSAIERKLDGMTFILYYIAAILTVAVVIWISGA